MKLAATASADAGTPAPSDESALALVAQSSVLALMNDDMQIINEEHKKTLQKHKEKQLAIADELQLFSEANPTRSVPSPECLQFDPCIGAQCHPCGQSDVHFVKLAPPLSKLVNLALAEDARHGYDDDTSSDSSDSDESGDGGDAGDDTSLIEHPLQRRLRQLWHEQNKLIHNVDVYQLPESCSRTKHACEDAGYCLCNKTNLVYFERKFRGALARALAAGTEHRRLYEKGVAVVRIQRPPEAGCAVEETGDQHFTWLHLSYVNLNTHKGSFYKLEASDVVSTAVAQLNGNIALRRACEPAGNTSICASLMDSWTALDYDQRSLLTGSWEMIVWELDQAHRPISTFAPDRLQVRRSTDLAVYHIIGVDVNRIAPLPVHRPRGPREAIPLPGCPLPPPKQRLALPDMLLTLEELGIVGDDAKGWGQSDSEEEGPLPPDDRCPVPPPDHPPPNVAARGWCDSDDEG